MKMYEPFLNMRTFQPAVFARGIKNPMYRLYVSMYLCIYVSMYIIYVYTIYVICI